MHTVSQHANTQARTSQHSTDNKAPPINAIVVQTETSASVTLLRYHHSKALVIAKEEGGLWGLVDVPRECPSQHSRAAPSTASTVTHAAAPKHAGDAPLPRTRSAQTCSSPPDSAYVVYRPDIGREPAVDTKDVSVDDRTETGEGE